jgi:CTP synthase (UTP-ammonia lyase)
LVHLAPDTRAAELYGATQVVEDYYCSYGVNPDYDRLLERHGLCISGRGATGEIRIVELPGHPFFLATLFLPQARSTPSAPHPLVAGYASAVRARKYAGGPERATPGNVPSSHG